MTPTPEPVRIRRVSRSRTFERVRRLIVEGGQTRREPMLDGRYFVAIVDGTLAGCVAVRRLSGALSEIRHLAVAERFRRRGIGTALVRRAAAEAGTPALLASVRDHNEASLVLFRSLGFAHALVFGPAERPLRLLVRANRHQPTDTSKGGPNDRTDDRRGDAHAADPRPDRPDREPQGAS